jgi:hypothetical protein
VPDASGSFDDVAAAAVNGVAPFIVAVCEDLGMCHRLAAWIETAVPALGVKQVRRCRSQELEAAAIAGSPARDRILVVDDAGTGDDAEVSRRWRSWNAGRERLRFRLGAPSLGNSVVFLVTRRRMPEIVGCAPDLLSVAHLITASEDPFALGRDHGETLEAFLRARRTLEDLYGLSTEEVIRRLFEREPIDVPSIDLNRWSAIAEALRELDAA